MKKEILSLAFIGLMTGLLFGQNYVINETIDSAPEYNFTTTENVLLSAPSDDVLSSWQTLPFTFQFYGQPINGYYACDNGYITFDNNATVGDPTNVSLPDAGGPNNAIYAFWDDMNVVSSDQVRSFNYGSAPNRSHVVQWYSVTGSATNSYVFCAIILHECGDFEIIHTWGFGGSGLTGTVGCENANGSMGTQVAGSPSVPFPNVTSDQSDDKVYYFSWDQIQYDLAISNLDLDEYSIIGDNTISGTIENNGASDITSFDLNYTVDGGPVQTSTITGINIPAYTGSYSFTHPDLWNVPTGGVYNDLCVWADNLNGSNIDERPCDDQACYNVFSHLGISGDRTLLVEEFTGAWCGFCPDGTVIMEQLIADNPGDVYGVSVHYNDDMTFNDGLVSHFGVTSYPSGFISRTQFPGKVKVPIIRGEWAAKTGDLLGTFTPADVSMSHTYNPITREINITVTADFTDFADGDLRFVAMVIEDSIVGVGSGYDQVNYFSSQSSSAGGTSHPFYSLPSPIIGYPHDHVLRAFPSGNFGNQGIIPVSVSDGAQYSETFTYVLPTEMNEDHISLTGFLANYGTNPSEKSILDVAHQSLSQQVGLSDVASSIREMKLYPNPGSSFISLDFTTVEKTTGRIEIFNAAGQSVFIAMQGNFEENNSISIDVSNLETGIYYISIITDSGDSYTHKLSVVM